jgi:hypothetical protein
MIRTTIDSIVRSYLASRQLPIHYYIQGLHYAMKCVRDLHLHVLQDVRATRITVDNFGEASIPADYIDWVRMGVEVNKVVRNFTKNDKINLLVKTDSSGNRQAYNDDSATVVYPPSYEGLFWTNYVSDYGENYGKFWGMRDLNRGDEFKVILDRGKIAVGGDLPAGSSLYLEYLSYNVVSATSTVTPYAEETIEAYIAWQFSIWSQNRIGEQDRLKLEYSNSKRKLKASMHEITYDGFLKMLRRSYKQAPKL